MKSLTTSTRNLTVILLTAAVLFISSASNAQPNTSELIKKSKCAIGNLKTGIASENTGLRKSAIYFAGEYRVAEVLPELREQLKKETDPKIKILTALVLYRIGDNEGLHLVKELALTDKDIEVRRMCASIYYAYATGSNEEVVLNYYK